MNAESLPAASSGALGPRANVALIRSAGRDARIGAAETAAAFEAHGCAVSEFTSLGSDLSRSTNHLPVGSYTLVANIGPPTSAALAFAADHDASLAVLDRYPNEPIDVVVAGLLCTPAATYIPVFRVITDAREVLSIATIDITSGVATRVPCHQTEPARILAGQHIALTPERGRSSLGLVTIRVDQDRTPVVAERVTVSNTGPSEIAFDETARMTRTLQITTVPRPLRLIGSNSAKDQSWPPTAESLGRRPPSPVPRRRVRR